MMVWLVMQHGGSSAELYPQVFGSKDEADEYIEDCEKASYQCDGPFKLDGVIFGNQEPTVCAYCGRVLNLTGEGDQLEGHYTYSESAYCQRCWGRFSHEIRKG